MSDRDDDNDPERGDREVLPGAAAERGQGVKSLAHSSSVRWGAPLVEAWSIRGHDTLGVRHSPGSPDRSLCRKPLFRSRQGLGPVCTRGSNQLDCSAAGAGSGGTNKSTAPTPQHTTPGPARPGPHPPLTNAKTNSNILLPIDNPHRRCSAWLNQAAGAAVRWACRGCGTGGW